MKDNFYIEEIITTNSLKVTKTLTQEEEIKQLYINENLTDQEKILHIFKKGFDVQKTAVIIYLSS